MNKAELIDAVASSTDMSKAEAGRAVDAVLGSITDSLAAGTKVSIGGFGNFEVRDRSARMGRNPQTGETIHIAATKVPAFKAAKALKMAVKG
ncbi:MAG: HU family DNA-binding protein [Pseudomonadota bacterium]|jgi:DNA-binding protein HU-beta|nr:HU family DNA-binding protein [Pseudomonadota bacterium]MEC8000033.1 HU family DNA-binding protein [Pseudomonadota bacterium]|tara:strand:+ start:1269 stop:1544 length:276 start_codon:yes stop_codon:yes gene_type:complete